MKISETTLEDDERGKPGYIMIEVYYTLVNWLERRLVFDQAREASKSTEPDGFNYFLELIFFSVGKEIQDRDSPTSSWNMLGTAFSSEGEENY